MLRESVAEQNLSQIEARITLRQYSPMQVLRLEADTGIVAVTVQGKTLDEIAGAAQPARVVWVELYGLDTTTIDLAITLAGAGRVQVRVEERYYSLPDIAGVDIAPRSASMMPSPTFITDSSLVRTDFVLP